MGKVFVQIDGISVECQEEDRILEAAVRAGIYIPNLCFLQDQEPPFGACRLCFVEIRGQGIVTACTERVRNGMVVLTDTPEVLRLRRTAAELIISAHPADCRHCTKNRHCELQKVASYLKVRLKPHRFKQMYRALPLDCSNPFIIVDPNKCVLCGKCIWICNERRGVGALNFINRGFATTISTFPELMTEASCATCMECVDNCPVGALLPGEGCAVHKE
ncbi:MAG: 2Fe-2S iron-sulfur cluster-binding protein [Chloroflexota bacterium]|nr:2Fe-2S iron-sulfur cluster-binding protein [Chloroflexota bacterium]